MRPTTATVPASIGRIAVSILGRAVEGWGGSYLSIGSGGRAIVLGGILAGIAFGAPNFAIGYETLRAAGHSHSPASTAALIGTFQDRMNMAGFVSFTSLFTGPPAIQLILSGARRIRRSLVRN